jgi:hypothetical protein
MKGDEVGYLGHQADERYMVEVQVRIEGKPNEGVDRRFAGKRRKSGIEENACEMPSDHNKRAGTSTNSKQSTEQ